MGTTLRAVVASGLRHSVRLIVTERAYEGQESSREPVARCRLQRTTTEAGSKVAVEGGEVKGWRLVLIPDGEDKDRASGPAELRKPLSGHGISEL